VGALNVGAFNLTQTNPQYVLQLFVPSKHLGQLALAFEGMNECQYVYLQPPSGSKYKLIKRQIVLKLEKLLSPESNSGLPQEDMEVQSEHEHMAGLRALTFQLASSDGGCDLALVGGPIKPPAAVTVRYVAMISPTISMGQEK
jgi:hypothetical protein